MESKQISCCDQACQRDRYRMQARKPTYVLHLASQPTSQALHSRTYYLFQEERASTNQIVIPNAGSPLKLSWPRSRLRKRCLVLPESTGLPGLPVALLFQS